MTLSSLFVHGVVHVRGWLGYARRWRQAAAELAGRFLAEVVRIAATELLRSLAPTEDLRPASRHAYSRVAVTPE